MGSPHTTQAGVARYNVKYSLELYQRLEAETGLATGFIGCGSIQLARTKDKAVEMRRGRTLRRRGARLTIREADGTDRASHHQQSDVWFKRGASWQIVHAHYSPVPT